MGLLDRGVEIKTPDQIDSMRRAVWSWGDPGAAVLGPRRRHHG